MNVRKLSELLLPTQQARRQAINHVSDQAERLRSRANSLVLGISQAQTAKKLSLHLLPRTIRISWFFVFTLHVFNAAYSSLLAYIYYYMTLPIMDFYVQLLRMMPQENYTVIIYLYACIGAIHVYNAGNMVFYSFYYRRLVFGKVKSVRVKTKTKSKFRAFNRFTSGFARSISARGEWFEVIFLIRKVSELLAQSVQAYVSTFLIGSVWVNQTFAVIIFLNAISHAVVHYFLADKIGLRRLYSTAVDLILDFTWGVIIPAKIFFVYMLMFMEYHGSFPEEFNYSDTLMLKAMLEFNQFFMISWVDAVTTTLPYLNMLSGLRSVRILIQHDMKVVRFQSPTKVQTAGPAEALTNVKGVGVPTAPLSQSKIPPKVTNDVGNEIEIKPSTGSRRIKASITALLPVFGIFVLITSIIASGVFFGEKNTCKTGCKLQMYPWFTQQCACSVMEISCYERDITGLEGEIRDALRSLDARVLNSLIISHCPALTIPEELRRFHNIIFLELYNTTVVHWPITASLSLPFVPYLTTIYIVRSRLLGGIPDGLTSDLSPSIVDIEFSATDFDGPLPDDLDTKWPDVLLLYLEHCGLQEFPKALAQMDLTDLSLIDNNISVLPESLSESFMYVTLDRNPIEKIPDGFESMTELFYFTVQYTNITTISRWIQNTQETTLNFRARGTPYCNGLPSKSTEARFAWCTYDDYSDGIFPLVLRDEVRAIKET
ncbi:hypothetical protein P3T76_005571 [Phytophthora citrophthora]|uniref:Uncharacterized protein n=1 Tax=Phytophthora citrophthora TaxID=4793 RepID=A0AAD9GQX5_9STRA|nr:hypothetical protein P3T76_005571 [Phytophthora citrophthora]